MKKVTKMRQHKILLLLTIVTDNLNCLEVLCARIPSQDEVLLLVHKVDSASSEGEREESLISILEIGVDVIPSLKSINSSVSNEISNHFSQLLSDSTADATDSIRYFADHKASRMLAESLVLNVSVCGGLTNPQYHILKTLQEMDGTDLEPAIAGLVDYLSLPILNPIADIGSESATVRRTLKHLANKVLKEAIPSTFENPIRGQETVGRRNAMAVEIERTLSKAMAFLEHKRNEESR